MATPRHSAGAATTQATVPRRAAEVAEGAEAAAEAAAAASRSVHIQKLDLPDAKIRDSIRWGRPPRAGRRPSAGVRPAAASPPGLDSRGSDCGDTEAFRGGGPASSHGLPPWPDAESATGEQTGEVSVYSTKGFAPKGGRRAGIAGRTSPHVHTTPRPAPHSHMKLQQVRGGEEGRRHDVRRPGAAMESGKATVRQRDVGFSRAERGQGRGREPAPVRQGAVNRRQ